MNRIIVIGCPGSGKSTFARALQRKTGLPLHHLDLLWHKPDRTTVSREEFDRRLAQIVGGDRWIIDGNYQRTIAVRLQACDTVFLFDLPVEVCLSGAQARIGRKREDLPWVETELDEEFRQWIIDFPTQKLPHLYAALEPYRSSKSITVFHSRAEADAYLQTLAP